MTDLVFPSLRPMSLVQLLDQAIRLYRRNFLQFIGIIAVPYVPIMVLQAASSALSTSTLTRGMMSSPEALFSNSSYWLGILGTLVVVVLDFFLVRGLGAAALTRAVADSYAGQKVGILSSYRHLKDSPVRLILALVLMGLISIVILVWAIIPCIGWISGLGLFYFVLLVVSPLLAPITVLENNGVLDSIRRAWDLSRVRFWWLIGFILVLSLFAAIVLVGPSLLINLVMRSVLLSGSNPFGQQLILSSIIQILFSTIMGLIYYPLYASAITMVYFDLRVRSEGLDLALQAENAPAPDANALINLPQIVPTKSASPFFTGTDILQFILLTLGLVAVLVLVYSILIGVVFASLSLTGIR